MFKEFHFYCCMICAIFCDLSCIHISSRPIPVFQQLNCMYYRAGSQREPPPPSQAVLPPPSPPRRKRRTAVRSSVTWMDRGPSSGERGPSTVVKRSHSHSRPAVRSSPVQGSEGGGRTVLCPVLFACKIFHLDYRNLFQVS